MRKLLIIIVLFLSVGNILALDAYPLVIKRYKVKGSEKELLEEHIYRYDVDTNLIEQMNYQVLDVYDSVWDACEVRRYLTRHEISEYENGRCVHSVVYSRDELDRTNVNAIYEVDTTLNRSESFYYYHEAGGYNNYTLCLTETDSIVSRFGSHCRLQMSQVFERSSGKLDEEEIVAWTPDSLAYRSMWRKYDLNTGLVVKDYQVREVMDTAFNRILFEDDTERQTIRYWYRSNGEIRKAYMRHKVLYNGRWKLLEYRWTYPRYEHGFCKNTARSVGVAYSSRYKWDNYDSVIFTREILALACLVPFTNKFAYEYEYLEKEDDWWDEED